MGTHNFAITDSRAGSVPFPKPRALVLPLHTGLDTADSDLMHHQFRLSLIQWNPGPVRKHPTNIVSAACGKFHAVILQEASDHVSAHLRSVYGVHWQHGPRYLAQQRYL